MLALLGREDWTLPVLAGKLANLDPLELTEDVTEEMDLDLLLVLMALPLWVEAALGAVLPLPRFPASALRVKIGSSSSWMTSFCGGGVLMT